MSGTPPLLVPPLLVTIEGGIARLRLNRPAVLNAVDLPMAEALRDAARRLRDAPGLRAVVLSGEGRGFAAGGDVSLFRGEGAPATIGAIIAAVHAAMRDLAVLPVPVLAAVHGPVAGFGLSLMLAADLALAADDARFSLAYDRLGTTPDGGATWALPRALGLRRALGLALLGETLDAAEALRIGLVNRVVPAAEFAQEVEALARRLADGPTLAYGRTKALLRASPGRDLAAQLDAERDAFLASSGTADFAEGVDAFLARRAPVFRGV